MNKKDKKLQELKEQLRLRIKIALLESSPLKNKVIVRRFGISRRYEEKDIIHLCNYLNGKFKEKVITKFEDKTGKQCVSFYKQDIINIFAVAFYDIKKFIRDNNLENKQNKPEVNITHSNKKNKPSEVSGNSSQP